MNFYSVYDLDLERYVSPFLAPSDAAAKAMVRDSLNPGSILGQYPKKFDLVLIGTWDESKGITGTNIKYICNIASLVFSGGDGDD